MAQAPVALKAMPETCRRSRCRNMTISYVSKQQHNITRHLGHLTGGRCVGVY
jgi:hypothetical protein